MTMTCQTHLKLKEESGRGLSPKLFNLYTEDIFEKADELPGVVIGGKNITNLRYADDTALVAESEEKLQAIVNIVKEESLKKGLKMNVKKTQTMVVTRKENHPVIQIKVNGEVLKQVQNFKYLGQLITSNGRTDTEVRRRIEISRQKLINMKDIITSRNIRLETRKRLVRCYILSTFLYASETWTFSSDIWKKIEAFEMWIYRKMLKVPYTAHMTNEEVLKRVNVKERILKAEIMKRKARYFGHIIRADSLQRQLLEGRVEGRRKRG